MKKVLSLFVRILIYYCNGRETEREREYAQIKVTWKVCNFKFLLKFSDKLLSYEILEKLVTFIWSSGF